MHPPTLATAVTGGLTCEVCGRLPQPRRFRLTAVKLAAVFPVELLAHAVVIRYHLPYVLTVALLSVTATLLVIWVVEPSTMRALRGWLHAPALQEQDRLGAAAELWRIRVTVDDQPGALETIAHHLSGLDVNILGLHVHPLECGARDELVVAAPDHIQAEDLLRAVAAGGGGAAHAWPTNALALVDGQTKALALAVRVSQNPAELPLAVAELLDAQLLPEEDISATSAQTRHGAGETTLHLSALRRAPWVLCRADEPFTPAETARAHRLAELAELAELARAQPQPPPGP